MLATTFALTSVSHFLHPWQLAWHADVYGAVPGWWVLLSDVLSSASLFLAASALYATNEQRLRFALALSYLAGLFWTWALIVVQRARALRAEAPGAAPAESVLTLLWMPAAAPAFVLVCGYVARSAVAVEASIDELRRQRYAYKSA